MEKKQKAGSCKMQLFKKNNQTNILTITYSKGLSSDLVAEMYTKALIDLKKNNKRAFLSLERMLTKAEQENEL